jgi:hypothetical protein
MAEAETKIEITDEMSRAGGAELLRLLDIGGDVVVAIGPYTAQNIADRIYRLMSGVQQGVQKPERSLLDRDEFLRDALHLERPEAFVGG